MSVAQRNLLIGILLAATLAGGMYLVFHPRSPASVSGQNPSIATSTATTTIGGVGGTGGYTVEQVQIPPPSIERPISITADLPDNAKAILRDKIQQEQVILRKEPTRVDIWLQLGVNRKIGGDYAGAIEAWDYVAAVAPNDVRAVAYGDLADLYMYFLKEYTKAEANYKQAIALAPNVIEYYRAMFYLYRDIFKDTAKAQAILTQGLKSNPNNSDLLQLQSKLDTGTH